MNTENRGFFTLNSTIERSAPRTGGSNRRPVVRERAFMLSPPTLQPLLIPDRGGTGALSLLTPVDETACETDKNSTAEQKVSIRPLPNPESQATRPRAHTWMSQSSQPHASAGTSITPPALISNHTLTNKPGRSIPRFSITSTNGTTSTPKTINSEKMDDLKPDNNQRTLPVLPPPRLGTSEPHSRDHIDGPDVVGSESKPTYRKSRQLVVVNPTAGCSHRRIERTGRRLSDAHDIRPGAFGGISDPKIPLTMGVPSGSNVLLGERSRARAHTTAAHSHSSSGDQHLLSFQSRNQSTVRTLGTGTIKGASASEPLGGKIKALPKVPILFENKVTVPETVAIFHHANTYGEDKSKYKRKGKEKAGTGKERPENNEELLSDDGREVQVRSAPLLNEHGQLSPPDSADSPNNARFSAGASRMTRPRGPRSRSSTIS